MGLSLPFATSFLFTLTLAQPIALASENQERIVTLLCDPAEHVADSVNSCEDNDAFIRAGEACLSKLEKLAKSETQRLQKNFSSENNSRQEQKFQSSADDYAATSASLLNLMTATENALEDIYEYKDLAVLPEDSDDPEVAGKDSTAYAMSIDCYGDTQASLDTLLNDFDHKLGELIAAKATSDSHLAKSGLRKEHLTAGKESMVRQVSKSSAQGSISPVRKKRTRSPSSITGVEEDMEKRLKK